MVSIGIGLYMALNEFKPIVFNILSGFVILLGTGFGLFGKYIQDKSSSQKSDKILENTQAFEGQLNSVQQRLNVKMKDILTSIDASQEAISKKTQQVEHSVQSFNNATSEGLKKIEISVQKIDTITNELAYQSNGLFFPVPLTIETSFEISWPISSREHILDSYQQKTLISHPHSSTLIYEIDNGSSLYRQVTYAFKNVYLTFKTGHGDIIYGLSIIPSPEVFQHDDNSIMYKPVEFNPTSNARVIYDQEEKLLKIMVFDCHFKLKFKDKTVTSFLDFQNSTVVLNVNDREDGKRVSRNLNVEASEYTDVIFGYGFFGGKQKDLSTAYESLNITINPDKTNSITLKSISSNNKHFDLGNLLLK
jgi:DNA-binding FrmR family transcriptional regulator